MDNNENNLEQHTVLDPNPNFIHSQRDVGVLPMENSDPTEPFKACVDTTTCLNNDGAPFHKYLGTPLYGDIQVLKECGPQHLGARDYAFPNMPVGTPVYAAESGKIIYTASGYSDNCPGGTCHPNLITIKSDTDGYVTQYVHMNPLLSLSPGDHVKLGQQIWKIDLSGDTTAPHVHMARFTADGTPTCNWSIPTTTTIPDNGLYKP